MAQRHGVSKTRHPRHISRTTNTAASNVADHARIIGDKKDPRTSDDATIAYIKRVLCQKSTTPTGATEIASADAQDKPLEDLLPPLTSSNEIDVQLYALISVILNLFVQTWYSRITPDVDFVAEVVQIIAHCTRGLEERLRQVDLESLLLDEIPSLLHDHLRAVESSREASETHYGDDVEQMNRTGLIYHGLNPLSALSPAPIDEVTSIAQKENETAWSQLLISGILPLILPPEDLENPCLRVLVSEIFSEMIFHNAILGKVSEPWLLWDGITRIANLLSPRAKKMETAPTHAGKRLEQFGMLSSERKSNSQSRSWRGRTTDAISRGFWAVVYSIALFWMLLKTFITTLMNASSIPPRVPHKDHTKSYDSHDATDKYDQVSSIRKVDVENRPIVSMGIWACTCYLLSLSRRMPWLSGTLSLGQWLSICGPGRICCTNSALDRLMSAQIHRHLLDPGLIAPTLRIIRCAIFPDNALAKSREPPTPDEVRHIKRGCAHAIVHAIPPVISTRFFVTPDVEQMADDVERTLDLFANQYCNKHLVVGLVELIVVRLFPELSERDANL